MDELQGFFKKYSPLIISLVGVVYLLATGEARNSSILLAAGLGMQYFWMRNRYPRR